LLNDLGDRFAELNQPKAAAEYFRRAKETSDFASRLRLMTFNQPDTDSHLLSERSDPNK